MASTLFYNASLLNGPSTESIPLILPSLPRLLFAHHASSEESCYGRECVIL